MLSYRHGFHAGNHADVLKHLVQSLVIEYLTRKDKPIRYIDTHSATGGYSLEDDFAKKTAEWKEGIGKIWQKPDLPEALSDYLEAVSKFNNNNQKLKLYPGSPSIAANLLREQDRLSLFELHPADSRQLARNFEHDRRVRVSQGDGFAGLKSLLPPLEKRVLILIDPPYEVKDDYNTVIKSLKEAFKRFAVGVYAVWYPRLDSEHSRRFGHKLEKCGAQRWLHVTLDVRGNNTAGMFGSGMFVVNPPWLLEQQLKETLPQLTSMLSETPDAGFTLKTHGMD
ncbi:23S rRNA (adenine(2030)-N(6))-methyltransferase RlmJ [Sansalvadorimonas sp. 2012CJ34-2]|uniref:Ribosomal RNA large subunit methyltransferase J n=1 Tax=Parendozoicomonas callyspongiae TaxID=2942213 RepID=A0ABT0PGL0_9GAMM|nr:23S rRNA (adenine(2030)-N(6))-methyltransferase RlmJ [Sansalvadorimonas sp. 2012CJ34-2]MCL6270376.1 23S rRNA (adenine(2030)-N(6))-methyltransferase RlmJ [Sansalvadorimonas sp. 2012CJ34-2]